MAALRYCLDVDGDVVTRDSLLVVDGEPRRVVGIYGESPERARVVFANGDDVLAKLYRLATAPVVLVTPSASHRSTRHAS